MKRFLTAAAIGAAAIFVLAGCAPATSEPVAAGVDQPVTIRLANIKAMPCAPTTLWEQYLPEGSLVEQTYFTTPADQVSALLNGSADVACTGITIGLIANEQEQDIRVIAQSATKGTGLIAATDSGIESAADLKGKTVGYVANSIHDVILRDLLAEAGLATSDVNFVNIGYADQPGALCSGQIDAFAGNEPNSSSAILQGCGYRFADPYSTDVGTVNLGLLTTQALIDTKPELMTAIVEAHAAAVDSLNSTPERALNTAAVWGFDKAAVKESLDNLSFTWVIDEAFASGYQALADRVKVIGLTKTAVDTEPIVVSTFTDGIDDSE